MRLDTYYLNMAETASERSKCVSIQVGCVLVINDQIVSTGLNGTLRGEINCCDHFDGVWTEDHHAWSLDNEVHAEMNAIFQAERSLKGAWAFCTLSPCMNCLKHMRAVGITRIYYRERYKHTSEEEITLMKQNCWGWTGNVRLYKEGEDDNLNH